jgi:hypothetical protein
MLGREKTKEKYHIYKLFGLQQSGNIEEHSETMIEFNEEDIWGGINDAEAKQVGLQENGWNGVTVCRSMGIMEGNSNNSRRPVKIPWKESCHEENNRRRMRYQSSAPLNIPNWSQMVGKEKKNNSHWRRSHAIVDDKSDDEEDDAMDFERIPPHELIARQLAQSEISSFSVYEGVGRTLKGRDLSRVRNAVWTKTGFIN